MAVETSKVWVSFHEPMVMPGTPEAARCGCLCNFERNLAAGFLAADRGGDTTMLVIHKDCPLHQVSHEPPPAQL